MFGINKYVWGGLAIVILLLGATTYFFYSQSQSRLVEISTLKIEISQLNNVIQNRDAEIALKESTIRIQEEVLKSNREKVAEKTAELEDIKKIIEEENGVNDDAHPSLKKLFQSLKDRK